MADPLIQIRSDLAVVRDHARHFGDFDFVYPVISRRSRGLSLGINLNPDKVCNFSCVYCEVDRSVPGKVNQVDLVRVREELVALIRFIKSGALAHEPKFSQVAELTGNIKDLAFSGDGEPTLTSNFTECVRTVAEVKRAEKLESAKIVLITDGAGLDKLDVRRGLAIMDQNQGEVWAKLDAGTDSFFKQVNRTTIPLARICRNILQTSRIRPLVIQSMFAKLRGEPPSPEEIRAYCSRLKEMVSLGGQIKEVHAYTVARPVPEAFVTKLNQSELEGLSEAIHQQTRLRVLCFD